MVRIVFQYRICVGKREPNCDRIASFQEKIFILQCRWQWGYKLQIFLWLCCPSQTHPSYVYSMEQMTLSIQSLALLGFFLICNNIFPIIDQCKYFFYLCDKVLIPKLFSRSTNISDLRREYRVLNFLKYDKKKLF